MSTCIAVRRHRDAVRPLRLSGAAADHPNKHSINTNAERVPFRVGVSVASQGIVEAGRHLDGSGLATPES